ncbi:MAG: hypothetical protein ACOCWG_01515 [bacterium]
MLETNTKNRFKIEKGIQDQNMENLITRALNRRMRADVSTSGKKDHSFVVPWQFEAK